MILLFWGCPAGLDFSLGEPGKEPIIPALVGEWENSSSEATVQLISIREKDAHSYEVVVQQKGETYALETDSLTGWVTTLNGMTFFYLKPVNAEQYFHYAVLEQGENELVVCDMALLEGGVDAVTSRASLQKEVAASMVKPEFSSEKETWYRVE